MTTTAYIITFIIMLLFKDQVKTILTALSGLITTIAATLAAAMKQ